MRRTIGIASRRPEVDPVVPRHIAYRELPPRSAELVIVGAGVVGAATAFHAARAGLKPVVIEVRPRPCSLTTPASTGAFRLQFDNQEELQLVAESVDLFCAWEERTGQREYGLQIRRQGYLWLTTTEEGAERQRRVVERQHAWGQRDVELLDGDEVRARFPYVSRDVVGGRFRAGDGFLDPKSLTMGLLLASGAEVVTSCKVTGFHAPGGRLREVRTSRGEISTEACVLCPGPFLGPVARLAGLDLPVEAVLRQKVVFPALPVVPAWAPMTIDEDTGAHWRPALGGAYLLFTDPRTPPSPPAESPLPEVDFAWGLLDPSSEASVARISPFWREVWQRGDGLWLQQAGQYTMTPDHRPLIGPTWVDGLFVNGGYSGHGIMGSPAGSRILVDVLTGQMRHEANPFRPHRRFVHRERDVL